MGGETFFNRGTGANAREAFEKVTSEARHAYGHGGYSGTIAEKSEIVEILIGTPAPDVTLDRHAMNEAQRLIHEEDKRISDKWGPAGCIKVRDGEYLFFGWASS